MSQPTQPLTVYKLRIVLRGVSPLIWRGLLVRSDTDLAQFHHVLQVAFAWSDEHIHRFRIHGKDYGIAYLGGPRFDDDPRQVKLSDFHLHRRECLRYEYNFSAHWELEIRLEEMLPLDPQRFYPVCLAGRRAPPPEDCAGAWAYLERLNCHKFHPPIEELNLAAGAVGRFLESEDRRAIGDLDQLRQALHCVEAYQPFQPDHFDRRQINHQLRALAWKGVVS